MTKLKTILATAVAALTLTASSQAVVIDFTGGTPMSTNTFHYEEDGYQVDFIGDMGYIGDYYGVGNNVLHSHWFGMTEVKFSRIDGQPFDLNYFVLTSNTQVGGGAATGLERTYITHDGLADPILLPSENWGFPAANVFLPSSYDSITSFSFHVESSVFCFGMDEFFIDQAPPVPDPNGVPDGGSTLSLLGLTLLGLMKFKSKGRKNVA